jgi:hypothetical protein
MRQIGCRQDRTEGDPNLVALLSLKLLLLAFFILLTALAQFETDKVALVVSSVNEAFDGRVQSEQDLSSVPAAAGPVDGSTRLTERVRNLFSSTLPMARIERDDVNGELRVELPIDELFHRRSERLKAGPAVLLGRLAALLGPERPEGTDYRLEMLVGVDEGSLSRLASEPEALPPRRAGTLARDFARRGMPPAKLSVGLLPGLDARVRLVLRVEDAPLAPGPRGGRG